MLIKDYTPTTIDEIVFSKDESRLRLKEILDGSNRLLKNQGKDVDMLDAMRIVV